MASLLSNQVCVKNERGRLWVCAAGVGGLTRGLAYPEHGCSADRALAPRCRSAVLQRNLLCVLYIAVVAALEAVGLH